MITNPEVLFPCCRVGSGCTADNGQIAKSSNDMSLRDYFAAKAMLGFCSNPECIGMAFDRCVKQAYKLADAMLEARKR